jgi:hypothetical protein
LIAKSVLFTTIRTLPGNPVAGHTPNIFIHAFLAYGKPASAIPAKHKGFTAAMTLF